MCYEFEGHAYMFYGYNGLKNLIKIFLLKKLQDKNLNICTTEFFDKFNLILFQ